jgi:hypothetical protein
VVDLEFRSESAAELELADQNEEAVDGHLVGLVHPV